ncbi:MAG: hypothetical protein RLZZ197_846 [Bacteroidota bacterium]
MDPAAIELPGNAVQAQLYLNKEVWVKFGIYAGTTLQFEELHKTKTDGYGLINLEIGAGENTVAAGTFGSINWGTSLMKIMTQVSFNQGAKYTEVSNRGLNYLPYAHFSEEAGRLSKTLLLTSGGTGATSAPAARANLGLGNVDNTADADKPVSGLVLAELNNKESLFNKSSSILADSASSIKYPTVKAIKQYVDDRLPKEKVSSQANSANLAAKATTLETPRTINGVPFDGSSNISIPIDAEVLTGIIPIAKGGTGAISAPEARTNLGLKIGVDVQAPLVAGTDYQIPLVPGTDYQVPLIAGTDYQVPLVAGVDFQIPLRPGIDIQAPLVAGTDYQSPLIAGTDYQIPLIAGTDYQVPLVAGTDYQAPLLAGTDYQAPLTAGSGIVLSGNSIAVSGLTTANLSATASITNGQLANSQLALGSTIASLGGTYTNLTGFASITSSNFVGDLNGNASTATTAVSASSAVTATTALTALTSHTASTASSATFATFATSAATATTALTANTATTLSTPRNIFGFPFDGSASISGILSPTYGGTGVNNGNKSITLGGDLITSGNYSTTIITTANTTISLPTSGTLATLAGTETLTNKTFVNSSLTGTLTLGGTTFPSSSGATGQVLSLTSSGVASWTSVLKDGFDETASNGSAGTMTTTTAGQTNFTLTQAPHSTSRLKMYINGILISQNAYAYKTSSSFASDATVPTPFLAYINAKNGTYLIAVGDRVQFVYSY